MKKTCTKYAVHKTGTEIFGSLCSYESEALELLDELKKNIISMPEEEKAKFKVVEVTLTWDDSVE